MEKQERKCISCAKPIEGRSDKKFCDVNCRSAYNSKQARQNNQFLFGIEKQLRKNRKILQMLNPAGKSTVRMEYLQKQGYDFRYFTNVYKTKKNRLYYFCFEWGVSEVDKEHILIVEWQTYMEKYKPPIA